VRRKQPTSTPSARPPSASVESKIADIGGDLARTFTGVLNAIPGGPHRPQWLARSLGVNTVLTSRILKAAQQHDPLAVAHMIPGPEPLRRLLRAAEKKKVDPALLANAREAVDRFQQLIDVEAGDRSALDAIISGWLPDARERVELIAKQSVFRGISQLLGTACDVEHSTFILYPSADPSTRAPPNRADALSIVITRGLRRVRPGPVIKYDTVHATTPMLTVTGEPVDGRQELLLEEFCSKPLPQLHVTQQTIEGANVLQYTFISDEVGPRSAVNLADATFLPARKELHRAPGEPPRKATLAAGIGTPSRTFIFDVLLHEDVYPNQDPTLNLYRTVGVVSPNDPQRHSRPGRDIDRLDVIESIQPLGQGIAKFRAAETPRYQDLIRHVCAARGWETEKLRGYRCRIEYPIYSSEIVMAFELPEA
jgi:hypothetical protein